MNQHDSNFTDGEYELVPVGNLERISDWVTAEPAFLLCESWEALNNRPDMTHTIIMIYDYDEEYNNPDDKNDCTIVMHDEPTQIILPPGYWIYKKVPVSK